MALPTAPRGCWGLVSRPWEPEAAGAAGGQAAEPRGSRGGLGHSSHAARQDQAPDGAGWKPPAPRKPLARATKALCAVHRPNCAGECRSQCPTFCGIERGGRDKGRAQGVPDLRVGLREPRCCTPIAGDGSLDAQTTRCSGSREESRRRANAAQAGCSSSEPRLLRLPLIVDPRQSNASRTPQPRTKSKPVHSCSQPQWPPLPRSATVADSGWALCRPCRWVTAASCRRRQWPPLPPPSRRRAALLASDLLVALHRGTWSIHSWYLCIPCRPWTRG